MASTNRSHRAFVPAMGRDWLLPLYDPLTRALGIHRIRRALLEQAALRAGDRVLDIGCGTGDLAVLVKQRHPEAVVVALDPDARALGRARRKARRTGTFVQFDAGYADALPYPDAGFDRVFSSFMLHHLERAERERSLREVRRVLKPGGRLHLVDFDGPDAHGRASRIVHSHRHLPRPTPSRMKQVFSCSRGRCLAPRSGARRHCPSEAEPVRGALDGLRQSFASRLSDNAECRVLALMTQAGFADAGVVDTGTALAGHLRVVYFQATAP